MQLCGAAPLAVHALFASVRSCKDATCVRTSCVQESTGSAGDGLSLISRALSHLHFRPRRVDPAHPLAAECAALLSLSQQPLDTSKPLHARCLEMLFECCVGARCPGRCGAHWEALGFQGQDPTTDLRAAGMLGMGQMLYLFLHNLANAERVWLLSLAAARVCTSAPACR